MYLIDMVDDLVSPQINSLFRKLVEEFAIQAPMREQSVKETDAKNVAADVLVDSTDKAVPTSFLSTCNDQINKYQKNWVSFG